MQQYTKYLKDMIKTVVNTIDNNANGDTQYDDVADYMEDIQDLIDEHFPEHVEYFFQVTTAIYINKGDMTDIRDDIVELFDRL